MVKFTKQYIGGLLAGVGLGIFVARLLMRYDLLTHPLIVVFALGVITTGGFLARSGQQKSG